MVNLNDQRGDKFKTDSLH